MMKKQYIKPDMQVYEVGTHEILAGSGVIYNAETPGDNNDDML